MGGGKVNTMQTLRVLVVDDEEMVRVNLVAFLEDENIETIAADSAEQALEQLGHELVDVCIVDMRLPGIDGNEFICRAHEEYPLLKFIIHTGSTEYKLPQQLMDIGVRDHHVLLKPLPDMGAVVDTLAQFL